MLRALSLFFGLCLLVGVTLPSSVSAAAKTLTFQFYGADNCPPCLAFKRNHLDKVRALGAEEGFEVAANMVPRIRDVAKRGSYGETDDLLRKAVPQLSRVYPPIFFVTKGEEIISVHGGNWRAALESARAAAK